MDYEMWLRVAPRTRFNRIPRTLAAFRVTGQAKSQRRRFGPPDGSESGRPLADHVVFAANLAPGRDRRQIRQRGAAAPGCLFHLA